MTTTPLTRALLVVPALVLLATTSFAQENYDDERSAFRGVGPRVGVGSSPDQLIFGVHFDLGRIQPNVRFQPDIEIGLGDDHDIFAATLPIHYLFPVEMDIQPYVGGGLSVGLEEDNSGAGRFGADDDTDLEMAIVVVGGLQWKLSRMNRFLVEINLIAGDLHDFEVVAGWTFR